MNTAQLNPARTEAVLHDTPLDAERSRFQAARDSRSDERDDADACQC
jgi:hypothetical protein